MHVVGIPPIRSASPAAGREWTGDRGCVRRAVFLTLYASLAGPLHP